MPAKDDKMMKTEKADWTIQDRHFGSLLLHYLGLKQMAQVQLAEKVHVTPSNLSAICRGKRQCGMKVAGRLAAGLGLEEKEKAAFVAAARKPRWKGMDHELYGPEAMLNDWVIKCLKLTGVEAGQLASVVPTVPTDRVDDGHFEAVVVKKNGGILRLKLTIQGE